MLSRIDFSKIQKINAPVIPVIVQHAQTHDVLTLAYVNEEALRLTQERKIAIFWSTSRNQLWVKGDTSGDYLDLVEIRINCEENSLLFLVTPRTGGVCHTKNSSGKTRETCFYRTLGGADLNDRTLG